MLVLHTDEHSLCTVSAILLIRILCTFPVARTAAAISSSPTVWYLANDSANQKRFLDKFTVI